MPDSAAPRPPRLERRLGVAMAVLLLIAGIAGMMVTFGARLSALRQHRATGPNWSFPSRVYSEGVTLTPGALAPEPYVVAQLEARGYRRARAADAPGTWTPIEGGLEVVLRGFADAADPEGRGGPERVRLRFADGRLAAVERRGGVSGAAPPDAAHPPRIEPVAIGMVFDEERMWRSWVSLDRVPAGARAAIVAAEDRRFGRHAGVDARAFFRALAANVRAGRVRQGGSTITQQLARGLFLGRERTFTRKVAEVPLALGLELLLSKDQILEMYLNSVYWGQARGFAVGGIGAAARWYFDTPVESLTVLEGATLAAMIPAPNELDPFRDPRLVRARRNEVLRDLVETRHLTAAEARRLAARPLAVRRGDPPWDLHPSFSGYLDHVLGDELKRLRAGETGLAIFTTLDLAWQIEAERAIERGLDALDPRGQRGRLEGALVALDPATLRVRAMVGGRKLRRGDFHRAFQARRQTGSAIKPIVYAAAFSGPHGLTPASTVPDTPRVFGEGRHQWTPRNSGDVYHPEVTLAKALEMSLNVATSNVVERVGPREVASTAQRFGLGRLSPVMSIGLGSNETTLLGLTRAFSVFAAGGALREPTAFRAIVDRPGTVRYAPRPESLSAVPPGIAALMTGLLENVVRYGVAAPLRWAHGMDRPVAGKTGTTNEERDAWFVGFTPEVVCGVWVGYDMPRPIGRQASRIALPLWARAVNGMLEGFPPTPFPEGHRLDWVDIDPWWGCLADSLSASERVPFLAGTGPIETCEYRRLTMPPAPSDSTEIGEPWFDEGDDGWDTEGGEDGGGEGPAAGARSTAVLPRSAETRSRSSPIR